MIGSVLHRRRAERFAQLLDEAAGARRHHTRSAVDDGLGDLVSVGRRLSGLAIRVEARPEFRDGLRAMLMATVEHEGIGATTTAPEPEPAPAGPRSPRRAAGSRPAAGRPTRTRGAIVVGLAAGTLALSGMSAASGAAIPGDALYSVKRSTEKAQLALAGSDISRGQLYLEFARTRLDEAQAVKDPAGLTSVLDDMDSETTQGVRLLTATAVAHKDTSALDAIDGFVTGQRRAAEKLRTSADGAARTRATRSVSLLNDIDRRSKALRPLVKCGQGAVTAPDVLGPVPGGIACHGGNKQVGSSEQQPGATAPGRPGLPAVTTGSTGVTTSPSATEPASADPRAAVPVPSPSRPGKAGRPGWPGWLFH